MATAFRSAAGVALAAPLLLAWLSLGASASGSSGETATPPAGPLELPLLNGFFVALFALSARFFRRGAHG